MAKRGRHALSDYKTTYKVQKEGIEWVIKYFYQYNVKDLFTKGKLSYGVEGENVKIKYEPVDWIPVYMDFKIELGNRRRADELRMLVQDFIVETYFLYEWDGVKQLSVGDIGRLFGIHQNAITAVMRNVKEKIRDEYSHLLSSE